MATSVNAYAVPAPRSPLAPTTIQRRSPRAHDVLIEIRYVGICHSDVHEVRGEWEGGIFPMVPGHEITGIVRGTGPDVTRYRNGDRVGVGVFVDSCRKCANCRAGREQYCAEGMTNTYNAIGRDGEPTYGGYSTHIVVDENYVLRIPEALPLDAAAPLLCAGITLYSPLRHWGAGPGRRVAIQGMGGLGHTGVMLAHALGAEVTVLSRSPGKRDDALRLGAHHFRPTTDPAVFEELAGSFDLVINTVSAVADLNSCLRLLRTDATLVSVGLPGTPVPLDLSALVPGRKRLAGSMIGGIAETQEMLDFCAAHGIRAEVEVISAGQLNAAYDRVADGAVRYRFVIDAASFNAPLDMSR
ncbi:NAD(P)-dependent alcohol dehydrogenase [Streptomyces sp. NPDC052396]|uniref:NAD(P)-dependent alcohol dehydrogenase n=1 Tax=Streptomyces sp. NPDC052396 TaxID=3365689 RepID=UPI0037D2ADE4